MNGDPVSGNRWGVNFRTDLPPGGQVEDFETNDFSKFPWEHEGDSYWTTTSWEKHSGNYSAEAGTIDDYESSTLRVTLDCISGNITFYRKVSSESGSDYLTFYIDGVEKDTWSGDEDWTQVSFHVTAGTRTFEWTYSKDYSIAEGEDTAWIDNIVFPVDSGPEPSPPPTPPDDQCSVEDFETNDFKKLPWEHEGDSYWTTTSWEKHSGNYSAQAGLIDHDESTSLKVTLNCVAGNITFYCKIYSEEGCDYLTFYIDGVEKDTWSGEEDWAEVSFPVTAGTRTFEWTYSKDYSVAEGEDTAWIDDIIFPVSGGPEPPPPLPPTPNLVGWWKFDEGRGKTAADSSGHDNHGSLNGGAKWTQGKLDGGVYLDGQDDYIEIPNIISEAGTMGFWFKPDWDGSDPADYRLFDASLGSKYFFVSKGANTTGNMNPKYFGFYLEDASDADHQGIKFDPAGVIFADTWFHVAVTWQFGGGSAVLYIDGQEASRANRLGGLPPLHPNPRFGLKVIGYIPSANGAKGVIDDIRIYNRALTKDEIQTIM